MVFTFDDRDINDLTGYFDDVAAILAAREHPIILVEETALRWMGQRVSSDAVIISIPILITIKLTFIEY